MSLAMSLFSPSTTRPQPGQAELAFAKQLQEQGQIDNQEAHQRVLEQHAAQELAMQQADSASNQEYRRRHMDLLQAEEQRKAAEWQEKQDLAKAERMKKGIMDFVSADGNGDLMTAAAASMPQGYSVRISRAQRPISPTAALATGGDVLPPQPPTVNFYKKAPPAPAALSSFFSGLAAQPEPQVAEPSVGLPPEIQVADTSTPSINPQLAPQSQEPSQTPVVPPPAPSMDGAAPGAAPTGWSSGQRVLPSPILGMSAPPPQPEHDTNPSAGDVYEIVHDATGQTVARFDRQKILGDMHQRVDDSIGSLTQDPNPIIANAARVAYKVASARIGGGANIDAILKEAEATVDALSKGALANPKMNPQVITSGGRAAAPSLGLESKQGKADEQISGKFYEYKKDAVNLAEKGGTLPKVRSASADAHRVLEMLQSENGVTNISGIINHAKVMSGRYNNEELRSVINAGGYASSLQYWENKLREGQPSDEVRDGVIEATKILIAEAENIVSQGGEKAYHWAYQSIKDNGGTDDEAENGGRQARSQVTGRYEAPAGSTRMERYQKKPASPSSAPSAPAAQPAGKRTFG